MKLEMFEIVLDMILKFVSVWSTSLLSDTALDNVATTVPTLSLVSCTISNQPVIFITY